MKQKRLIILLGIGGVLAVGLLVLIFVWLDDPVERQFRELSERPVEVRDVDQEVLAGLVYSAGEEGAILLEGELSFEQIVALLRQKYGDGINYPRVQVAMLEELMRHLQKRYPDDWVTMLQELLLSAFPDRAANLFRLSENLYRYGKEMEDRRDLVGRLSREERREVLWEMRYDVFGAVADEIWESERKMESVQGTLRAISENKDLSLQEKLSVYRNSLQDVYGQQTPDVLEKGRLNFVNAFTDAVQSELAALAPEERASTLREIRSGLGMDAAALERWESLDAERDQRWSNGEIYTSRRKELEASYSGAELEQQLDGLRRELFGEEAEIIKQEEASGFFRFQNARRFGRE